MLTNVIFPEEYEDIKVSSLPSNPTANTAHGGLGYNAIQMKAAFDALPVFIIERFNRLVNDITARADVSISADMRTEIPEAPKLSDVFEDIKDGQLASYLMVGDDSLATHIAKIWELLNIIKGILGVEYE